MHVRATGTALPPHFADQDTLVRAFESLWGASHHNVARVRQLHEAVLVSGRHLALPIEAYAELRSFGDANDVFLRVGTELAGEALQVAMRRAGLDLSELDALFVSTVTGVATPSLDARVAHRLGLREDLVRVPIFGLGCAAGAAGLARVADWLKAWPEKVAALVCVELCSLTLQRGDMSVANLIATGLFGDGAAAVVAVGADRGADGSGPRVVASASRLYPDSERVMGWDIGADGFRVVLDRSVPDVVRRYLRGDVDRFLARHGLKRSDVGSWICHPGGPKVLEAMEGALELPRSALARTWRSLREIGNLSSASVLFVLDDALADPPPEGGPGLMLALGPGFASELVLLEWPWAR